MSEEQEKNGDQSESEGSDQFPTLSHIDSVEAIGTQIGSYKILSILGEGGFGIVYLAEQKEILRRQVALKVIKPGMDSKQVIARFESERQALALLDHPNVAHVFDGGTTENGRPYFVMELVKGLPITEHCDKQKLSIQERLELFQQVCDAVHHAHQRGIIHRDIKPSNTLVSVQAGKSVPIIIDFGVAKAISQPLTERTLFTEKGQMIGTPEYMSPEQAELTNQDIDTRSDIYSLGVLLYELLTGTLPFDPKALRRAAFDQILKTIREKTPPSPSRRVSQLGKESKKIAENRRMRVATLITCLRMELERIPLKAMHKVRACRYQSADELAQDIHNYLYDKPLLAGSGSITYRVWKFTQRHREAVVAAIAVVFAICLASSSGILWYFQFKHNDRNWKDQSKVKFAEQRLAVESLVRKDKFEVKPAKEDLPVESLVLIPIESLVRMCQMPKIDWPIPPVYHSNYRDPMDPESNWGAVPKTTQEIVVSGIVHSEDYPLAIIDRMYYGVGEKVRGATILEIKPNSVTFEKDGKTWTQIVHSDRG